jgi:hypothetical protein
MTTLMLVATRVDTLRSGYDLRVARLCALIPDELHVAVRSVGACTVALILRRLAARERQGVSA